ncbi:membrane protein [Actinomycetospora sp. NBRC 106375]|uniref:EamA family transporter n=1 Tax=Actinomycetospora sp. NBRC 106375 TaxID=3032207 RepID=UPI0024A15487|nr:EamA family transporter [Actinomycetospora sp. NBRC 106375]GLZ47914.1 membrane protein [Actinomycetospora sp. NBRC 106375]
MTGLREESATRTRAVAVVMVLVGQFSVQFGATAATGLFGRVGPVGAVALRLAFASLVLLAVCRPRVRGLGRRDVALVVGFGVALAGMNSMIYEAIARIPLGAAVTLEVLGPLVLSVAASRRASSWLWAALAVAGVALLGRGGFADLTVPGVLFALGAATMWAAYILASQRAGGRFDRLDGLALAMTVGAVLTVPLGVLQGGAAMLDPVVLGWGAAVALLSSLVPYSLELLALRRLPASAFSVLMSLAPAIAATAGFVVLGQELTALSALAIALVVVASIGAVRASRPVAS